MKSKFTSLKEGINKTLNCVSRFNLSSADPFLFSILFLILLKLTVCAQSGTGEIDGVVSDEQGALIPGAPVILKSLISDAEPLVFKASTSSDGSFRFSGVPVGRYEISVKVSWFGREFVKSIDVKKTPEKVNIAISLAPCSDEPESVANIDLSNNDRAEIARMLVSFAIRKRGSGNSDFPDSDKPLFDQRSVFSKWLTQDELSRIRILSRSAIQKLTEKYDGLTYFYISKPVVRGTCISASLFNGLTVKGQEEDANMAGGSDNFEFRKVNGKWESILLYSTIS